MIRPSLIRAFDDVLEELGEDHVSWLLVAAHNYLRQKRADRATILLEFLGLLDPHNLQGRKMLAYAHWLQGDRQRCAALIENLLRQPLSDGDLTAMEVMKLRLGHTAADANAENPPPRQA